MSKAFEHYTHNIKPASPMLIADNLSLQRTAHKWCCMVTSQLISETIQRMGEKLLAEFHFLTKSFNTI